MHEQDKLIRNIRQDFLERTKKKALTSTAPRLAVDEAPLLSYLDRRRKGILIDGIGRWEAKRYDDEIVFARN